ncbi:LOW QUALITY PROTEIN: hypothetical protein V1477_006681 [Vespula maculifrons]|uniref:Uncharacterized protein n=1 Tax=Vespula maculifrons TaxID=7453 RepID=A0ABD2CKA7_VESMC
MERARPALSAREPDRGHWKGLVAPSRPIFSSSRSDKEELSYNGLKGTKEKKHFSSTIFFSQTILNRIGVIGKGSSRPLRPCFFRPDRTNRSRVITHLGEPDRGHWKGLVAPSRPIFSSSRSDKEEPSYNDRTNRSRVITVNRIGVIGKGSSRPLRPYFFRPDRTNRSRVITHLGEPDRGHWKGLVAPSRPIFSSSRSDKEELSYNGLKGTKENKHFSLTIFFSETIEPRRTGSGYNGLKGIKENIHFSFTIFFSETVEPRRTVPGSLERARRALYAHIFFVQIGPIGAELIRFKGNKGKKTFFFNNFFLPNYSEPYRGYWKGLVAPSTPIYNGLKATNENIHFSFTIFFSQTVAPRRTGSGLLERARRVLYDHIFFVQIGAIGAEITGSGSLERDRPAVYAHIFFVQIGAIGAERTGLGSLESARRAIYAHIFSCISDQKEPSYNAPRITGPGSLERAPRALYAHIFFVQIGPIGAELLRFKGNKGKKTFFFHNFFLRNQPRRTVPGSLERARRALYAHIFFVQIGPIGAELLRFKGNKGKKTFFFHNFFLRNHPRRTLPGSLERAPRALHAHIFLSRSDQGEPSYNGLKGTKEKKHFSLTIFFSQTVAPRRTGPGSLERALRALYAHISFVQIGPIGAESDQGEPSYNGLKGTKEKKIFSLTIFFSETIAPRRTGPGCLERARRALYAHIFFVQIGPIGAETQANRIGVLRKGSSRPLRPYFFRPDRTNRSQVITGTKENIHFSFTIFFSETVETRRTVPGSLERARRALYAHIFFVQIGEIGADYNGLKGTKENIHFSFTIFFSETVEPRRTVPGSLERARRALYAHIFFVQIGPIGAELLRFKGNKGKKTFFFNNFFLPNSPRRTGPGSLERALRALYAHISFVQIGPIGADYNGLKGTKENIHFSFTIFFSETVEPRRTVPGSLERARRALYAHIFFEPSYNGLKGTKEKKHFSLTIFFSQTVAPRRTGPGSLERALRALYAHISFHLGERGQGRWKVLVAPSTPIFFRPDRTNRSRVITEKKHFSFTIFFSETVEPRRTVPVSLERAPRALHAHIFLSRSDQGETSYNGLKGTKLNKHFSLTIFFSETIEPRRTGSGSLERARRALYAHIFFHLGERGQGRWKVLVAPSTPIFFRPDRTNRSRVITEKKHFSFTIFFSETVEPRRTVPGSLERAPRALHAHIFLSRSDQGEPSYNGLKGTKEKKHFSLTIFFSQTVALRRTGPGSLERALRALYAHISFVQIGPIGAEITAPGSLERAPRALHAHIFLSRSDQGEPSYNGLKGTKENKHFSSTIFFSQTIIPRSDQGEPSYNGLKETKEKKIFSLTIFFSETIAPRRTGPGCLERARRALYAHIFFVQIGPIGADTWENRTGVLGKGSSLRLRQYFFRPDRSNRSRVITLNKHFSLTIFFSETIKSRRTVSWSLERARRALYAHIFFVQIGPIGVKTYENRTGVVGKGSSRTLRPYFFRPDRTNRSRVNTYLGEPYRGYWKGLVAHSTPIFSSSRSDKETQANRIGVLGKRSSRRLRPYFFRPDRSNRSRVITEPSYNGLKGTYEEKHFSLTIFFSQTIAPRRTGPGSLESARRAIYAHIFSSISDQKEPSYNGLKGTKENKHFPLTIFFSETIAPRITGPGSLERAPRALHAHIFFIKICQGEPSYNGLKGTKEKKIFSLTIFFSETIAPRRTAPGSLERALRDLYAHISFVQIGPIGAESDQGEPSYNGLKGTKEKKIFSLTIFFSETIAPRRTGPGCLERARRALYAHIFLVQIGAIGADTWENRTGVLGKGSSLRLRQYFFRPDRSNRSRVITEPSYNGLKGTKENKHFSLTIFFSQSIAPRRTGPGSLERDRPSVYANIFFVQIGAIGAERTGSGSLERARRALYAHIFFHLGERGQGRWKVLVAPSTPIFFRPDRTNRSRVITEKKHFSFTIFFSETVEPRRTVRGSLERAPRALHAHIFLSRSDQGEPSYNGLKGTKEKKHFSLTIFFSQTVAPRRTGPGSLERALRALYAHISFVQIGPIGAEITAPGSLERAPRALHAHIFLSRSDQGEPSYNGLKGTKEKKIFSLTIFFSETIAPRRTGPGSLERARRALYAHIFFVQIGPIGAESDQGEPSYNGLKGTKEKKIFSLTIFFSETIAPRRTGPGCLERARRALYAHIFFVQIGPIGADTWENRTGVLGKGSSLRLRQYFFRPDRSNRSRVITLNKHFSLTIFFSETIKSRRTVSWSLERARRALYAHIFFVQIGPIGVKTYENRTGVVGKGSSRTLRPYFFRPDRTNRSRVNTYLGEPYRGYWKGLVAHSTPIFSSSRSDKETQANRIGVLGKRSSRRLRPYFFRPDRSNRSRVITEPSYNGLKGTYEEKHFSLTIFFSQTIAPRRTGPGSLESARRAIYAHIFSSISDQKEPSYNGLKGTKENKHFPLTIFFSETIAPRITGPGSLERAPRALHAHIFFIKICQGEPSYNGLKGTKEKKIFSLTIFFSETIAPRRTAPGSLERALRDLYAHISFVQIGPIGAESDQGEPSYNGLKGTKEKKIFSLTIFFSETIAPRRTGPGCLERARRALYAHIFFVQIGAIGADTWENRTGVLGKGSSLRLRQYFFRPDRSNRSRVITPLGEMDRGALKGLVALSTPIFFSSRSDQGEPSYNGLKGTKEKKIFSLTIFFSETIAPRRTGPGSLERARRALYAHIFSVQIGPIGAETQANRIGVLRKGSSRPLRPNFFHPDRTNRSQVITVNRIGVIGKGSSRPLRPYFFRPDRTNRSRVITEPSYNGLKGIKENIHFSFTIFFSETVEPRRTVPGSLEGTRRALYAHIFFVQIGPIGANTYENRIGVLRKGPSRPLRPNFFHPDRTNRSQVITGTKENIHFSFTIFFSETVEPRRTVPGSLERARRALYAHIFFVQIGPIGADYNGLKGIKENIHFSFTIFFSETVEPRRTVPGSLERARSALYAHIFFVQIGPIGAELIRFKGNKGKKTFFFNNFFLPNYSEPYRGYWKGLVAPSTPIFEPSYNGLKGTYEEKHFSLTIFFSETVAPRKTGPGSLEGTRRALYAHIFFVQIEPIGAERTGPGSLESARRAIYAHIFSSISDQKERSYNGLKGTMENKHFPLTIFFSQTIAPRRTGSGSLERDRPAVYAHIFFVQIGPIGADTYENRIGVLRKGPSRPLRPFFFVLIGPIGANTWENRTGVLGKGSSRRLRPYFFRPDRSNRSRVITHLGKPDRGRWKGLVAPSTPIFFSSRSNQYEPSYNGLKGTYEEKQVSLTIFFSQTIASRRTGPGSLESARRAIYAHIFSSISDQKERSYNGLKGTMENKHFPLTIFFSQTIAPRRTGYTYENRIGVLRKGPSRPLRPYFFRPDRTNRSQVITGTKENIHFSFTIFFSETVEPRRTVQGSLERARRAHYAQIFFVQIGPIGAELLRFKGNKGKKTFFFNNFFLPNSPRRTGPGSLERALRALYAHISFVQIGPIGAEITAPRSLERAPRALHAHIFLSRSDQGEPSYNGLKGTKEKKIFSLTIFFSETIAPRRTGPGSLERARRALYAHIFFVQIGPIGAESDQGEPSYNGLKGTKEKKIFSLTIFFSETIAPRRTGPGYLERARRALYAHIFFVQIGPIGADTWENRTGVLGKGSSLRLRQYFFRPDRSNRSRVITLNKHFSLTIFFSETIKSRRTVSWSLERARRALYAHIFFVQIGPIGVKTYENRTGVVGKGSSRTLRPYFFRPDRTNRSRVNTYLGEPYRGYWKGLVAHSTPIFSSSRSDKETQANRIGVLGKRSSRRLRPYFFRPDRSNRSRVITEPSYNGLKGTYEEKHFSLTIFFSQTIAPRRTGPGSLESARRAIYAHIFSSISDQKEPSYNGLKGTKENKHFPLTIFFSETIAPRITGPGSLERAPRALHAHIFFIKICQGEPSYNGLKGTKEKKIFSLTIFFSETIAPRRTAPGSLERALRDLYAHISFVQIGPIGAESDQGEPSYNGLKGTKEKKIFSLTIFFSETIAPRRTGPGCLERARRALYAHIFFVQIGAIGADTWENRTGVLGKGSSLRLRQYFFRPDRSNRSRVITPLGEMDRGALKGLVALSTPIFFSSRSDQGEPSYNGLKGTKEKKIFSLTIFFSETIAPRRTGPGSLERARRALYAHIFSVQIGPIGAETQANRIGVLRKGSSRPLRPNFFHPDRTNRSQVITVNRIGVIGKGSSRPLRPYFFRPDRTNRSRVITEPSYNGLKGIKENIHFSFTIFFSETVEPRRTVPGSLERARRALYAHIFFIQIGPIGAELIRFKANKGKKTFFLNNFFLRNSPRKTGPGSLEGTRRALYAHIFFVQIGPIGANTYENRIGVLRKGPSRPLRPNFFHPDRTNRSQVITGTKENIHFSFTIFFSETVEPRRTVPGSLERARRALYAHIFFVQIGPIGADYNGLKGIKENIHFSFTIFFSETVEPRRTVPGSLERARSALYAHIFFVQIGPIGAELIRFKGNKGKKTFFFNNFFLPNYSEPYRGYWKGLVAPSTPIFEPSYNGLKGTYEEKHFSLTIFFSETVAPRKTGPGSLEGTRRALYAHIFFVQIEPIGAERTGPGSLESARRAIYAHIFSSISDQKERSYNGLKGTMENKHFPLTIFFSQTIAPRRTGSGSLERDRPAVYAHIFFVQIGPIGADTYENRIGVLRKGPSRPLRPFFFVLIGPIGANTWENRTGVLGKGSSRRLRPYFFRPDRSNRSRVITHLGKPDRGRWKGLVAPSTPIFFSSRSNQYEPSYNGLKGTYEEKQVSLTIFFSQTIASRRTGPGSLESARRAIYAHIFSSISDQKERSYNGLKGTMENKHFPLTIFFSQTIAPRRTGYTYENRIGVLRKGPSRPLRPYFFRPDRTNRSQVITGTKENIHFSFTIFFSETVEPRRTVQGSLERARRAHYAQIFFVQIGPIGAELLPPRSTGSGLLESARRALYASIFFVQIGAIEPSYNGLKGTKENIHFSFTIFFSETVEPRRTVQGSLERARRAHYAQIFFVQIGPIGAEKKNIFLKQFLSPKLYHLGEPDRGYWKGLVAPSTPIFFSSRSDQQEPSYNCLKGTKEKKHFSLTIFFSQTIAPRRTGPGSDQQELSYNGLKGTNENKHFSLTIFFSEYIAPVRTGPGCLERDRPSVYEPIYNGLKGTKENIHFSLTIFFSDTIEPRRTGSGSLEWARRALYAHIFFEPSYNVLKGTKENIHFSFTILFSETVEPRRTEPGSLERARRALYAHIFFVQIGAIGAELLLFKGNKGKKTFFFNNFFLPNSPRRTGSGLLERARRALYAHIFFHLGEPDRGYWKGLVAPSTPIFFSSRSDQQEPSYNCLKGTKEKKHFSLTIFFSETVEPRRTVQGSLERARRAHYAQIFFVQIGPIGAEKKNIFLKQFLSPKLYHLGEPDRGYWKGLVAPSTPIFFSSRSDQQEPSYNCLKGTKEKKHFSLTIFFSQTIAPRRTGPGSDQQELSYNGLKGTNENKHFSLTIFFSEYIAPVRTGPGCLERDRPSVYEPIYNGLKGTKENIHFSLTIFFSDTIEPRRTGSGSLEWARRALYAHIFFEPSYNVLKGTKENIHFSFTILFSETVEPRRTEPGSLERARRALYAHIFFVQIGAIGAELLLFKGNKGKKTFFFNNFFLPNSPRRTGSGLLERARRALYAHIFFVQIGAIGAELLLFKGNKGK